MFLSIIVAMSKNHVIGQGLQIPWKIPGEQKRFKELTLHHTIIMGRKTFESIGKPLPKRKTIVVTRNAFPYYDNVEVATSIPEALELCAHENEVFIAGGGQIYQELLPLAHKIYLTIIDQTIEGNIFFPPIHHDDFTVIFEEHVQQAVIPYTYYTLERKRT